MFRITFVISILVVVVVAFAACGDSEDEVGTAPSRDEYFLQLQERFDSWLEANLDLVPESADDFAEDDLADAALGFQQQGADLMSDLARAIDSLAPPPGLAGLQLDLTSAADDMGNAWVAWVELVREVDPEDVDGSESTLIGIGVKEDLAEAAERFESACNALEDESSGRFRCSEGEESPEIVSAGGDVIDIAPGITGRLVEMPELPGGIEALSDYIEFDTESSSTPATIGLPLKELVDDASDLWWYSFENGEWQRLDVTVRVVQSGTAAQGDFEAIPASLAILREK